MAGETELNALLNRVRDNMVGVTITLITYEPAMEMLNFQTDGGFIIRMPIEKVITALLEI